MRNPALDILRAFAVLLVLGRHMTDPMFRCGSRLTDLWYEAGWIGVDLFFVLSGFLVGGLLMAEVRRSGQLRVGRFYVRRAFKIYPAFYVLLITTIIVGPMLGTPVSSGGIVAEAFFIQNYKGPIWQHTWSLAVEEHFYILLPLLLGLFVRRGDRVNPFRKLPMLIITIGIGLLAWRIVRAYTHAQTGGPFEYAPLLYRTHIRIDALFLGVLLAYLHHYHAAALAAFMNKYRGAISILATLAIVPAVILKVQHPFMHSVGLTLLALGFAGVLLLTVYPAAPAPPNIFARFFAFLGMFSYSVYLWHLPFRDWVMPLLSTQHPIVQLAAYVVGSFAVGIILGKLIEWPMLAIRDRFFPSTPRAS